MTTQRSLTQVLLIEDDIIDIEMTQRAFDKLSLNFPLIIAKNGIDALNKLQGKGGEQKLYPLPKLILLDIRMPKMNGIEFANELRKDPTLNGILIFVLTTSNNERDIKQLYDLNIAGYFLKHVEYGEYLKTIEMLKNYWLHLILPSHT